MITLACGCQKNRAVMDADGKLKGSDTYRIRIKEHQVYESHSLTATQTVAERFGWRANGEHLDTWLAHGQILGPGEEAKTL